MSDSTFFTFPLCLLSIPADEKQRLQFICTDAFNRAGGGAGAEMIDQRRIRNYAFEQRLTDYNENNQSQNQLARGALICNIKMTSFENSLRNLRYTREFVQCHEAKYGNDPLVFISTALFWGCHNNDDPPYREFSTLCAVNSIIGFKQTPVLIRRGMILARQLGYKTPAVMKTALAALAAEAATNRKPKSDPQPERKPLTIQQLRHTLDRLEGRQLIARCQASRTCVYFSTTLSADDLRGKVQKLWESKNRVLLRRQLDRETVGRTKRNQVGTT